MPYIVCLRRGQSKFQANKTKQKGDIFCLFTANDLWKVLIDWSGIQVQQKLPIKLIVTCVTSL